MNGTRPWYLYFFPIFLLVGYLFEIHMCPNSWFGTTMYVKLQYNSLHHRNVFPFFWYHQFCCFFTETLFTIQTTPSIDYLMWNCLWVQCFVDFRIEIEREHHNHLQNDTNICFRILVGGIACGPQFVRRRLWRCSTVKITQNTPQWVAETRVGEVIP